MTVILHGSERSSAVVVQVRNSAGSAEHRTGGGKGDESLLATKMSY